MTTNQSEKIILDRLQLIEEQVQNALSLSGRSADQLSIMAVTKTVDPEVVNLVLHHGIHLIGENRVQEFLSKQEQYDLKETTVHFIGNLQTNKVKQIISKVDLIESVSSLKLAEEIQRCAQREQKTMPVFLEINIGEELSKSGFLPQELNTGLLETLSQMQNISVQGLMCIPPKENTEKFFDRMEQLFVDIKEKNIDNINMAHLSMGMSADYVQAIRHHATIIRLGTALFGERIYR